MVRLAPRIKIITLLYSLRFLTSNYCRFQKFRPSTPTSYLLTYEPSSPISTPILCFLRALPLAHAGAQAAGGAGTGPASRVGYDRSSRRRCPARCRRHFGRCHGPHRRPVGGKANLVSGQRLHLRHSGRHPGRCRQFRPHRRHLRAQLPQIRLPRH